jgi:ABC-type Na+ efflux pump permease subunit
MAYTVLATLSSVYAIAEILQGAGRWPGMFQHIVAAFVVGFQVSIGLLLLSVRSVTTLAEERVGDSLDLLLVSPLPTRSIVWGKWLGAYGRLPWLAFWPMIIAGACSGPDVRWLTVGLVFGRRCHSPAAYRRG